MSKNSTRRQFLQNAASVSLGGILAGGCRSVTTGSAPGTGATFSSGGPLPWSNWAGNQSCQPSAVFAPSSEAELASILRDARGTVRPVGAGHSFSALVPNEGTLVAVDFLEGVGDVDDDRMIAEVGAGTRLHQLGPLLEARGHALPNLPDINYQTIAGATATSTHGTGVEFGSLSSLIEGIRIATPTGELVECDQENHSELFQAARCSLGALGVVTRLALRTQASLRLAERLRFEELNDVLEEIDRRASSVRHFELFAFPHSSLALVQEVTEATGNEVATTSEADSPDAVNMLRDGYRMVGGLGLGLGELLYDRRLHQVAREAGESVRVGPSYAVLTHDRLNRFREMEYTVPADAGPACLREILEVIKERDLPLVYPLEYRYVQEDDAWLSMFYRRSGCSISVHQFADEDHRPVFEAIEPIFWKYDGRPHWGKIHSLGASELARIYPRFGDFQAVREETDPSGKMLNEHLRILFEAGGRGSNV